MLSQNQSRYLVTIGFALLALLFASDLLLKPPKELVLLAIDCISALYFTATLFVGLKERKIRVCTDECGVRYPGGLIGRPPGVLTPR